MESVERRLPVYLLFDRSGIPRRYFARRNRRWILANNGPKPVNIAVSEFVPMGGYAASWDGARMRLPRNTTATSPASEPSARRMLVAKSDALLRCAAVSAISAYQRRLSPLKGFSCAHRVLHGGVSCSQHIKELILKRGPRAAVKPTRVRFAACREANEALRADAYWPTTRRDRRRRGGGGWRRWLRRRRDDASDIFDDTPDGGSSGCEPDCDVCDCAP